MGGIRQCSWSPTKRRGPIAADYSSPGPACVTLPNLIGEYHCQKITFQLQFGQDSVCTYNVALRCVPVSFVAVEEQ
jgi:hypothetical protein